MVRFSNGRPQKFQPFLESEHRQLLIVMRDSHDHFVEEFPRPLDHIQMAVGYRVETAGINRASHSEGTFRTKATTDTKDFFCPCRGFRCVSCDRWARPGDLPSAGHAPKYRRND